MCYLVRGWFEHICQEVSVVMPLNVCSSLVDFVWLWCSELMAFQFSVKTWPYYIHFQYVLSLFICLGGEIFVHYSMLPFLTYTTWHIFHAYHILTVVVSGSLLILFHFASISIKKPHMASGYHRRRC